MNAQPPNAAQGGQPQGGQAAPANNELGAARQRAANRANARVGFNVPGWFHIAMPRINLFWFVIVGLVLLGVFMIYSLGVAVLESPATLGPWFEGIASEVNAIDTTSWYTVEEFAASKIGWTDWSFYEKFYAGLQNANLLGIAFFLLFLVKMWNSIGDALKNLTGPDKSAVAGHLLAFVALIMPTDLLKAATLYIALDVVYRDKDAKQPPKQLLLVAGFVFMMLYLIGANYYRLPTQSNLLLALLRYFLHLIYTGASWGWLMPAGVLFYFAIKTLREFKKDGTGLETIMYGLVAMSFLSGQLAFSPFTGTFTWLSENIKLVFNPYVGGMLLGLAVAAAISLEELLKADIFQADPANPQVPKKVTIASWYKLTAGLLIGGIVAWVTSNIVTAQDWPAWSFIPTWIVTWITYWLSAGYVLGQAYQNPQSRQMVLPMVNLGVGDHSILHIPPVFLFFAQDQLSNFLNLLVLVCIVIKPVAAFFGLA